MNELNKYSNFKTVNDRAKRLYNKEVSLSTRKDKKYMTMNDNNVFVHFGQLGYSDSDFTKNLDENKKRNYLARATKKKEIGKKIYTVLICYQSFYYGHKLFIYI
jgi:hypothetical protein